jgi:hypothetical protein
MIIRNIAQTLEGVNCQNILEKHFSFCIYTKKDPTKAGS